jgi:hypothetical protein
MKTLHPRIMYTPPWGGVQGGGVWGVSPPLLGGLGGVLGGKFPDGGSGAKPLKEKFLVNVYCNFIVNLDRSL